MRTTAVLALLFSVVLAVASCTSTPPTVAEPTGPVATTTYAGGGVLDASTARGGTLRAVAGTPDSLDPGRSYLGWMWNLMRLYNRTLVTYGTATDGQAPPVVPDLATDTGTASADGRTWMFTLKSGLLFDDGTPITSKSVKYGIERSFAADVITGGPTYLINLLDDPNAPYSGPYEDASADKLGLASIATPDDATIVFTLQRPYADFRYLLTMPTSSPVPQPRDSGDAYAAKPASSGPYKVDKIDTLGIQLSRNPSWSAGTDSVRTASPDRISVRTGLGQLARDQAVLSGAADLDLTNGGVSERTRSRIAARADLTARSVLVNTGMVRMLAVPVAVAPFNDPGCRQAVAAVLQRKAVVSELGGASVAASSSDLWPSTIPGYQAGFTQPPPRDKATFNTCFPAVTTVNLAAPNLPVDLRVADALARSFAASGLTVAVKGSDPATYYGGTAGNAATVQAQNLGLLSIRWSADYPGMSSFLVRLADSRPVLNAGSNFAGLSDPAVDQQIDAALGTTPPADRELWVALSQQVSGSYAYIPLVEERATLLAGAGLTNARVNGAYHGIDVATVGVAGG